MNIDKIIFQGGLLNFCILLIVTLGLPVNAGELKGKLRLTIIDENDKIVPARVEIVASDGEGYVANDALLVDGDCGDPVGPSEFLAKEAIFYDLERSLSRSEKAVFSPFSKNVQFYSTGQSEIDLPVGTVSIKVMKGFEYYVVEDRLEIEQEKAISKTIKLSRWVNMPKKGWYSADDHLHIARSVKELNPFILGMLQAEDIHVGNLVQMGTETSFALAPQYAYGKKGHYQRGHHMLASGQENPRTELLGHALTLGADEMLHDSDNYLIYRLTWEEARKQGAVNGMAHMSQWGGGAFGMALILPHDLMHFVEVLQYNTSDYEEWYKALNLGFRVTPTAGSDYPCPSLDSLPILPGNERFYTKVEGEFSYDNWLKNVQEGRTFVTTGPMLEFQINGKNIGDEIFLEKPDRVTIEGLVHFDKQKNDLDRIELIENGQIIASIPRVKNEEEIKFSVKHKVEENSWYAIRGFKDESILQQLTLNGPGKRATIVHSAPIYVTVKDAPSFIKHPRAQTILRTYIARLNDLERRLDKDNLDYLAKSIGYTASIDGVIKPSSEGLKRERADLLAEILFAKKHYLQLLE